MYGTFFGVISMNLYEWPGNLSIRVKVGKMTVHFQVNVRTDPSLSGLFVENLIETF